jgi:hypothetical protein
MDEETCECAEHGKQPIAYACKHIIRTLRPATVGFVSYPSEDNEDLRDAWCDDCNAFLQSNGGEWVDGRVEVPGGIDLLCAECYRSREADALRVDRRTILQA